MLLYQILVFTIYWKKIKKSYKNNKFKILAPTWNEKLDLPDGSNSVSDIQNYFDYILKRHGKILLIIQEEYIETKLKIGLYFKLTWGIISIF